MPTLIIPATPVANPNVSSKLPNTANQFNHQSQLPNQLPTIISIRIVKPKQPIQSPNHMQTPNPSSPRVKLNNPSSLPNQLPILIVSVAKSVAIPKLSLSRQTQPTNSITKPLTRCQKQLPTLIIPVAKLVANPNISFELPNQTNQSNHQTRCQNSCQPQLSQLPNQLPTITSHPICQTQPLNPITKPGAKTSVVSTLKNPQNQTSRPQPLALACETKSLVMKAR